MNIVGKIPSLPESIKTRLKNLDEAARERLRMRVIHGTLMACCGANERERSIVLEIADQILAALDSTE